MCYRDSPRPGLSGFCNHLSRSGSYEIIPAVFVSICAVCRVCISAVWARNSNRCGENCNRKPVGVKSAQALYVHKTRVNKEGTHSLNLNNEQVQIKKGSQPDLHSQSVVLLYNLFKYVSLQEKRRSSKHSKYTVGVWTHLLLFMSHHLKTVTPQLIACYSICVWGWITGLAYQVNSNL